MTRALLCAALVALPCPALAYRPFNGTDADVAQLREIELEIGPVGYQRAGGAHAIVAPSLIANWGFARDLELVLEGRQVFPSDVAPGQSRYQLVDTQLDVKWLVRAGSLQAGSGASVASEWTVLLPETGRRALGAELAGIASWRWPALSVHANGAAAFTRDRNLGLFAGLIAEGPGDWRVRPVAEVFVDWESSTATQLSALAGAIWPLREGLSLDAAARVARIEEKVGPASNLLEIRLGFTRAFSLASSA